MHTPGPWEISKIGNNYEQYSVYVQADDRGNNIANTIEGQANARLIAAAPELLEALEYALAILLAQPNADDMGLYQIQQAIAHALE